VHRVRVRDTIAFKVIGNSYQQSDHIAGSYVIEDCGMRDQETVKIIYRALILRSFVKPSSMYLNHHDRLNEMASDLFVDSGIELGEATVYLAGGGKA
jgi:hypothetical protein